VAEFPVERGKIKKCPKCYKIFEGASISTVVAHVGSFHDEVIKYSMDMLDLHEADKDKIPVDDFDDGTIGVPVDRDVATLYKCDVCGCSCETRSDLKNHYLDTHYAGKFMEQFPVPFCQFCDQEYLGLPVLHRHIVNKHEAVFSSILFKDGLSLPSLVSPRRKRQVLHKGTFDFPFCQICLQEVQSSRTLKIHYIRHYQIHFQKKYFTITCPYCEKSFDDVMTTQKHIATDHSDLSLIPLMESEKLWVDKSVILESTSTKLKRIGIPLKKVDKAVVKKHFDDLELLVPQGERKHDCVFPSCDKVFEKKEQFLIHLAISHFWKDLALDFGEAFEADSMNCPVCKEKVNPNMEKTTYYKHLAVAHETVMKYVQTIGREEPTLTPVNPVVQSSSSPRVPVIRFSNETQGTDDEAKNTETDKDSLERDSEIDRILKKHGASSLVNGTTADASHLSETPSMPAMEIKEEMTTEENLPSAVNTDLLSKIRNVFSDESDSD